MLCPFIVRVGNSHGTLEISGEDFDCPVQGLRKGRQHRNLTQTSRIFEQPRSKNQTFCLTDVIHYVVEDEGFPCQVSNMSSMST